MDLHEVLEVADAPDELVRWAREEGLEFEDAWTRCGRVDHRIWLAACGGIPIERVIEAAALAVFLAEERSSGSPGVIGDALDLAAGGATADALVGAALACEQIAAGGMGDYRIPSGPGTVERARAAALIARAAEALLAGEARREANRLEHARATGANLGIGMQSVLPRAEGPARLDVLSAAADPAQGAFLFCVAACAQAGRECVDALVRDGEELANAERDVDAAVLTGLSRD